MSRIIQLLIDFIFPPNVEELKLRSISPENFQKSAPSALKPEFPFINSLFSYKDPLVRELIWQIKYKKNKHAVKCAGYALHNWLNKQNFTNCTLIPIPISRKRRNERGYNQCELIINEIIKLDSGQRFSKNYNLLVRSKNIDRQTLKNRDERIENTKNIFELNGEIQKDSKIIIIDDVSTTGSTLREARDAMLKVGYSDVQALSVAH